MNLDHDSKIAVEETVQFVNTDDRRAGEDTLTTVEALAAFLDDGGYTFRRDGSEAELRAVRRWRARLREVFDKASACDRDGVVDDLNRMIAEAGAVPWLVEHDDQPLHFHYTPPEAPLHHSLGAEMAIALAIVVRDGGFERLRVCEAPDCGRIFVDVSRNRSRRYCDTLCGNRQNVAAYRQRQASGSCSD